MYVFAGFDNQTHQYSFDLSYLNLDTMEWTYVVAQGKVPAHRDFHTATLIGDRMYVYGGRGDHGSPRYTLRETYCSHLYYLDTIEEKWYKTNPRGAWPDTRRSCSACKYFIF